MTIAELNRLPYYRAEEEFRRCCASKAWARNMARRRPFSSPERLLKAAEEIWWRLEESDWAEACEAHSGQEVRASAEEQNKVTLWRLKQFFPL
jgi:2-oxo-4-hydroxy-4-carboxy-5-ureidoimidazoline decarboxylase